ncbi:hypothetical protein ASC94_07475 [Massilia sp. Root418]|jgi:hypothetical protein|nr:hypothetical protein ASC94_07475 [Massilia sp. Root418]
MTATAAKVMLACLGVYWVSLLMVSGSPGKGADTAIKVMLGAACVFLVLLAHYHAHGLHDAVRVLGAQRAPDALWRAWLRAWLATVTRYWAAVSVGAAVQLAMPASSTFWLAGPALLSLLLCFAALRAMAQAGLAPPVWRRAAKPAVFAVILVFALGKGPGAFLDWFAALPAALLLAFSLAWPALAWSAWRRHGARPPAYGAAAPVRKRVNRATAFMQRYTVLQWQPQAQVEDTPQVPSLVHKLAMLMNGEILFYVILLQTLTVHWNSSATPLRALGLLFICVLTAGKLAVRDLHWRGLLLPGGLQRKRIGTHILLSTLTFQMAAMLLVAVVYLAARIGLGTAPAEALASVLNVAILPLELVFATSAAVLLRTLPPLALALLVGAAVAAGIGALYAGYDTLRWSIGPGYALFLAAGTAACTWLANRRWTPEKLLRNMRPQGVFA